MAAAPGWWPVSAPSWTCLDRSWTGSSVEFWQNLTSTDFNSASCFFSISATDFMSNSKTWQLRVPLWEENSESHPKSYPKSYPSHTSLRHGKHSKGGKGKGLLHLLDLIHLGAVLLQLLDLLEEFLLFLATEATEAAPWAPKKSQVDWTGEMSILDQRCDQISKYWSYQFSSADHWYITKFPIVAVAVPSVPRSWNSMLAMRLSISCSLL